MMEDGFEHIQLYDHLSSVIAECDEELSIAEIIGVLEMIKNDLLTNNDRVLQ